LVEQGAKAKQGILGKRRYMSKEQIMASMESRNDNDNDLDEEDQEVDDYNMQDKDLDSFSNNSSSLCLSKGSTTLKLSKIERKI
jgi:hypothetical protein